MQGAQEEVLGSSTGWPAPLRHGAAAILELARTRSIRRSSIQPILEEIASISRVALEVERASVWLLRGDRLECSVLVEGDRAGPSKLGLSASECPLYVQRLRQEPAVAIRNVQEDPSCAGLEAPSSRRAPPPLACAACASPTFVAGGSRSRAVRF